MTEERAIEAARRAGRALARSETREAAWLALWSTELDGGGGLGLAVLARILHEISGDPLATVGTHAALMGIIPEPERSEVARFHRIDRWSRGLIAHRSGQALLPAAAFEAAADFEKTRGHDDWFSSRIEKWGSVHRANLALCRLVAALFDAWEMPQEDPEPLRSPAPWPDMPSYAAWKRDNPLAHQEPSTSTEVEAPLEEVTLISDHWTADSIERLESQERLTEAVQVAERWAELRPDRMAPRMALLRIYAATGAQDKLHAMEQEVAFSDTEDLNELEEARVGLGLLGRFQAQLHVLERMDRLAPGHSVIIANRGAARLELERTEEAEADLRLALELDPESGPALTNLALLRMRESDFVTARGLLEQAKLLFPEEAQIRYYLATCLQHQARVEAALREAKAAVDLDPAFAPGHALLAQLSG